jgi:hypothetical protein
MLYRDMQRPMQIDLSISQWAACMAAEDGIRVALAALLDVMPVGL